MTARPLYYPLIGGLDQESAPIAMPPGRAIAVLNHESVSRGYQRTQGYERIDGRAKPSDATYFVASFTAGVTAFVVGQTVTGFTSGAAARVLATPVLTSGAYDGTGVGTVALHLITGTFTANESLRVAGVNKATLAAALTAGTGMEDAANLAYLVATREYARALITAVPGSGPVRGILYFGGKLHAWRDNVGATAGVLHQSGAGGWTAPNLGTLLLFKTGTIALIAGNAITGGTSGATAVIRSVALNAGTDWSTGNAAGTLVLDTVVGTFVNNEAIRVGGIQRALADGGSSLAVFPAGGRYDFAVHNFYGTVGTERAYGANGVGKAFEYDGASIVPITTGMPDDRPFLAESHKKHLFLAFPKGSLQHSAVGEPRSFTAILGAAELGLGHEITNLVPNATSALIATTDRSLYALTGNDSSDWLLEGLTDEAGGKAYTAQRVGQIVYLDERGVRSVTATQAYGNFRLGTFTSLIHRELENKRRAGITPVGSCVVKSKDQYLLFFSDGSGLSIYFGRKNPEAMMFKYPFVISCLHVAEVAGVEAVFVGATDGFVYELNSGTSFDGAVIEAFIQLPFGHQGAPRLLKRYHKAVGELIASPGTQISLVAQFDYGAGLQPFEHSDIFTNLISGGGIWDVATWDDFYWDSPAVAQVESYLQGLGVNMSLLFFSSSATMESYTLQGITLLFTTRGQKR